MKRLLICLLAISCSVAAADKGTKAKGGKGTASFASSPFTDAQGNRHYNSGPGRANAARVLIGWERFITLQREKDCFLRCLKEDSIEANSDCIEKCEKLEKEENA
jgi:hypothetical protein